jgi:hypothetical protein
MKLTFDEVGEWELDLLHGISKTLEVLQPGGKIALAL